MTRCSPNRSPTSSATDHSSRSPIRDRASSSVFRGGGVLFVDDAAPETGVFSHDAKRELARVLPDAAPIPMGTEHVVFRSFYFIRRPYGRVEGPPKLEAIIRGGNAQVIFSSHDLAGALAQSAGGIWSVPVTPGGEHQRERALRLAVNVAMYVLCSNYKDDQGARSVPDAQACGRHAMMVRSWRALFRPRRSALLCGARARAAQHWVIGGRASPKTGRGRVGRSFGCGGDVAAHAGGSPPGRGLLAWEPGRPARTGFGRSLAQPRFPW